MFSAIITALRVTNWLNWILAAALMVFYIYDTSIFKHAFMFKINLVSRGIIGIKQLKLCSDV